MLVLFKNDNRTAIKVLKEIYTNQIEADAVLKSIKFSDTISSKENKLFIPEFKKTIILAFLVSFFNQLSGINFILYYAPEILEMGGFATKESLFNSVIIGVTNIVFTFPIAQPAAAQAAVSPTIATVFAAGNLASTALTGSNILYKEKGRAQV